LVNATVEVIHTYGIDFSPSTGAGYVAYKKPDNACEVKGDRHLASRGGAPI
jgi:hypothetical protein